MSAVVFCFICIFSVGFVAISFSSFPEILSVLKQVCCTFNSCILYVDKSNTRCWGAYICSDVSMVWKAVVSLCSCCYRKGKTGWIISLFILTAAFPVASSLQ